MNFEIVILGLVLFLLFILADMLVPLAFDKPHFALTMRLGEIIDNCILKPIVRWVLIQWYTWRYKSLSNDTHYYLQQMMHAASDDEKAAYRAELVDVLRRRAEVHTKLCEVRDVH